MTDNYPDISDTERRRLESIPKETTDGNGVIPARKIGSGRLPLVATDGQFDDRFAKAANRMAEGRFEMSRKVFPFELYTTRRGRIEVRHQSQFYWEDEDTHVVAEAASIDTEGRVSVDMRDVKLATPRKSWRMTAFDIAQLIEAEQFRTAEEVDEIARELLAGDPVDADGDGDGGATPDE